MAEKLQIQDNDKDFLVDLFGRCLPGVAVWAYGSRAKGLARKYSDLDLVVFCERNAAVAELVELLDESSLPFRVDLHCWNELPETFRSVISSSKKVLI